MARESERGISPVARDLGLNPETLRVWCGRRRLMTAAVVSV
ncbi:hypothetical protein [Gaiella sp.]